jgi:leucyl aminopeptidase
MIKSDNVTIESINKWNLEKRKIGGIVAVGKGSMNPPQLVSIAYQGDPDSRDVLAVVGKGVTYDSGGLSLKSHANLEFMKDDMAGAATAVGVIRALILLKYPVNVLGGPAIGRKHPVQHGLPCR